MKDATLPFNLRHRRYPSCFELNQGADTASLRAERERLKEALIDQIRPILRAIPREDVKPFEPTQPLSGRSSTFLRDGEMIIPEPGRFQTTWEDHPAHVYVRYIPERDLGLTPSQLRTIGEASLRDVPPFSASSGNSGLNRYGFVNCAVRALPDDVVVARDAIQFFRSGEVWAIFGSFLRNENVVAWIVEDIFAWSALQIAKFTRAIGYTGPARFIVGMTGIQALPFAGPDRRQRMDSAVFHAPEFLFEQTIRTDYQALRRAAEKGASQLWMEAGLERPSELSSPDIRSQATRRAGYWDEFSEAD